MERSFLYYIEHSIKIHWNLPALTDFEVKTLSYKEVAQEIERLRILFEKLELQPGDRVGLCSRNMCNWGVAFLACQIYGCVAVPILNEFRPDNIHHIINHCDAKLLFIGRSNWEEIDHNEMPQLKAVVAMEDFTIRQAKEEKYNIKIDAIDEEYKKRFPSGLTSDMIHYRRDKMDELSIINYTSGTTSASKGVMLTYLSMWSNLQCAIDRLGYNASEKLVSILTMAHMYGLAFEFIYPFVTGTEVYFISKNPAPKVIAKVFSEVKPHLIVAVPLIIEKIIRKMVMPKLNKFHIKLFMRIPIVNNQLKKSIRQKLLDAFGGRFKLLSVGGAALNHEVESFLASVRFPYTVAYGMTECGPGISFADWRIFRIGSCGKVVERMEMKIDSEDEHNIVGEIMVRGDNVMTGYYNNPEATAHTIDEDGWLHTGDLGVLDHDGFLYIKGRSKNLILGPSGQNIYPEEIEDKINVMQYVAESLVLERDGKLVALVYPDPDDVKKAKLSAEALKASLDEQRKQLNLLLPGYSQITRMEIQDTEFEKTPKKSIKRFMYK
ncbi:MAG: AMP-binding protein [Marinifilaceae bacterium]